MFENLEIGKDHKFMEDYQGKIPVIYLTMKECSSNCYENFLSELRLMMQDFLDSYPEIKDEAVSKPVTRQRYEAILNGSALEAALAKSLADIMKIMERNYDHKVAVLIDEYDAPVFNIVSDESNNRMKILNFMSRFYGNAMKDNPCLAFALITGVHRIAKENLFSGFNNLSVSNVQNGVFSSYFGFTFNDVKKIVTDFNLENSLENMKEWYNGYRFGDTEIYNPWSIMNSVRDGGIQQPYWKHTSRNGLVLEALKNLTDISYLEKVYEGEAIPATLDDGFTFEEAKSDNRLLSLMVATGYLKPEKNMEDGRFLLSIPNKEIQSIFRDEILEWCAFPDGKLIDNICKGKFEKINEILENVLLNIASYYDTEKENFYHGLMLGLLVESNRHYIIESNKEAGERRFNICMIPKKNSSKFPGILIELKKASNKNALHSEAKNAIKQIKAKKYLERFRGIKINGKWLYGISFFKKSVYVKAERIPPYNPSP